MDMASKLRYLTDPGSGTGYSQPLKVKSFSSGPAPLESVVWSDPGAVGSVVAGNLGG